MSLGKDEVVHLYRRRARRYDVTANLYYLIGFREQAYRERAVRELGLRPGGTVVEMGCGTGLNFPLLERAVGPQGRIIGVDMTDAMLEKARERMKREGWRNVELVKSDVASYEFPRGINGVISTFALTLSPDYDRVIQSGTEALAKGGRIAILDLKRPKGVPLWLTKIAVSLTKPFGVTLDIAERRPWESIRRHLMERTFIDLYFGFAYVAVGEKRANGR